MAKKTKCPPPGSPAWMATFADLMSLLMCFFVLLLSFAQMDQVKFKEVSGSMRNAFGDDLRSRVPGTMNMRGDKDFENNIEEGKEGSEEQRPDLPPIEIDLLALEVALEEELRSGIVTIEDGGGKIAVRIEQVQAFPSGSADLLSSIGPTLSKIGDVIRASDATVRVDGHTDNVPIKTARFRSNWELSAARAATVVTSLTQGGGIDSSRMEIRGHADTKPLYPNDSSENRARNRRIEIVLDYDRAPGGSAGESARNEGEAKAAANEQPQPTGEAGATPEAVQATNEQVET
ncbi:MAG: flagellar motor protein MotB [Gammaproteobacteria bacterium]